MMSNLLQGKAAVITGGAGNIGSEIALDMARQGVKLVVNDTGTRRIRGIEKDPSQVDRVVTEIKEAGGIAIANYDSVTDFVAAENIINTCVKNFGKIDILVNSAGGIISAAEEGMKEFWEINDEIWDGTMDVNLKGTFHMCRHALALMTKQNYGRIINFSSQSWLGAGADPGPYVAAKGGIVSLTMSIGQQMLLEGYNITCNAIAPLSDQKLGRDADYYKKMQGSDQMAAGGRWERLFKAGLINQQFYQEMAIARSITTPNHISPVVLYLAADETTNINGQVFGVSKGRIALYSEPTEIKGLYKEGVWTLDELVQLVPVTLTSGIRRARG
jgi:NAD(P)-dependent dehydrogenase (short-subunit alcohol dehydrogenase family)